jgi:hypothetical protein
VKQLDVLPAARKPALFSVFCFERAQPGSPSAEPEHARLLARDEQGRRSPDALALRRFFDLPVPTSEPPSPRVRPRGQAPEAR